ncbi:MAG: DNA repair protein RecN [Bacteroides sp.]|nr:DNA repair protein RecN [Bacteroides sp.]
MLRSLYIQNYALIEKLDIDIEQGFSVITGETGAGKSIILGAIGLLLGQRADVKAIRQGADRCTIEAQFDIEGYNLRPLFEDNDWDYDSHCIIRRELQSSGKSRAFVNDTPASLAQLKELGERLIDVHSQHQNLLIKQENFQLNILDLLAQNEDLTLRYQSAYTQWTKTKDLLTKLQTLSAQSTADQDYLRYQLTQIDEAKLSAGEETQLEEEAELLAHAEDIKAGLYRAENLLMGDEGGSLTLLKDALNAIRALTRVYPQAEELSARMEATYIELKDLTHEISSSCESVEFNPRRLEEVNERLNLIYSLQQKHRVESVAEILKIAEDFRSRLDAIDSSDDRLNELTALLEQERKEVDSLASQLSEARSAAARQLEQDLTARLLPLGMPYARFQVELTRKPQPSASGIDTVNFLFSANKNGTLQNLSSVASGGEIARVMLSLKALIAGVTKLPTIIFDEIDTGVSGEIADRMAEVMKEMSGQGLQVISITHLPQIASQGNTHYKVYKQDNETETNSHIRRLSPAERVEEIAHMLSGATLTDAALQNAKALLGL